MQKFLVTTILLFVTVIGLGSWAVYLHLNLEEANNRISTFQTDILRKDNAVEIERDKYTNLRAKSEETITGLESRNAQLVSELKQLRENETVLKAKDTLLAEEEKKREALQKQYDTMQGAKMDLQKEFEQQKHDYTEIVEQLKEKNRSIDQLKSDIEQYTTENSSLQKRLQESEELCAGYRKKNATLEKMNSAMQAKPIKGKVKQTARSGEVASGCIIIGELSEKPEVGTEFSVFQKNEYIGRAKVYRSFESMAGATISNLVKGKIIEEGDIVVTGFPGTEISPPPSEENE